MMLTLEYFIYHVKPFGGDSNIWLIPEINQTLEKAEELSKYSPISQIQGNDTL